MLNDTIAKDLREIKSALGIKSKNISDMTLTAYPISLTFPLSSVEPIHEKIGREIAKSQIEIQASHERGKKEIIETLNSPLSKLEGLILFVGGIGWKNISVIWLGIGGLLIILCLGLWFYLGRNKPSETQQIHG